MPMPEAWYPCQSELRVSVSLPLESFDPEPHTKSSLMESFYLIPVITSYNFLVHVIVLHAGIFHAIFVFS